MTDFPIILDPGAVRAVRSGRIRQVRLLASSPLFGCAPGDRLWVRESCVGGQAGPDPSRDVFAAIRNADFVVFMDGWRQYRGGEGRHGRVPTSRKLEWTPAVRMPRWAARTWLTVEAVRVERLHAVDRAALRDEGQIGSFAGFHWHSRRPGRGIWRDPLRAFATLWNATHGTDGERWDYDPEVVVLRVRMDG